MVGTQLPVVLPVVVLHQLAQDVEELLKADLVVLVLVCHPEQLCDVARLLPALRSEQRVNPAPQHHPAVKARRSSACWWGECGLALSGGGLQETAPHSDSGQDPLRCRMFRQQCWGHLS